MIITYENDYESFDHEIDAFEVNEALENILDGLTKEQLIELILNVLDNQTELEDYFYDDIKGYFATTAWETYRDNQLYEKDPLGYYGMSQKDFI